MMSDEAEALRAHKADRAAEALRIKKAIDQVVAEEAHAVMLSSARGRKVEIWRSDENGQDGYAILHPDDPVYWLGHEPTRKAAEAKARVIGCIPVEVGE